MNRLRLCSFLLAIIILFSSCKDTAAQGGGSEAASDLGTEAEPATTPSETTAAESITAEPEKTTVMFCSSKGINIRSGPSQEYEIIGKTEKNQELSVTDFADGWYEIIYNGGKAYISADFVSEQLPEILPITAENKLPVIYISTENNAAITSCEEYVGAEIKIDGCASGFPSLSATSGQIRGRGHSTWLWLKKPYKIKFDEKTSVFGLQKAKDWVLLANYADKTLLRNFTASRMSRVLTGLSFTSNQILTEVYLNGEYQGVYTLCEQLEVKEGRVEIDEEYDVDDTGYLLETNGVEDGVDVYGKDFFNLGLLRFVRIKSPDTEKLSASQFSYIKNYVQTANDAIVSLTDYEDYIDVDSFIDWAILHELTYNLDSCFRRSCFITKPKGGKLRMGPVWDFDLAFGNFCMDNYAYNDWATLGLDTEDTMGTEALSAIEPFDYSNSDYYIIYTWFNYLMSDKDFINRYRERWNAVKDLLLDEAYSALDDGARLLNGAQQRNFDRWACLSSIVGYESSATLAYPSFEGQIKYVKTFLKNRYDWLDAQLAELS